MRTSSIAAHKAKMLLAETSHDEEQPAGDEPRPEMVCFRGQTLGLVRHFFEISSQAGRVSSLLGREFFRSRVSHHVIPSFEEQAVFVRDIELCLAKLPPQRADVLMLHGLHDYSAEEVSLMLHCSRSLVRRYFYEALDTLGEIFLRVGLLRENQPDRRQRQMRYHGLPPDEVGSQKKPPASVRVQLDVQSAELCDHGGYEEPQSA